MIQQHGANSIANLRTAWIAARHQIGTAGIESQGQHPTLGGLPSPIRAVKDEKSPAEFLNQ